MFERTGATALAAPVAGVCAPAGASVDNIVDLLRAISRFTRQEQIDDFVKLLWGRLSADAGGPLDDDQTEILARMAAERRAALQEAREKRQPPAQSYFPVRPKSDQSRQQAGSGKRDPERWERKRWLGGGRALPGWRDDPRFKGFTEGERAVLYIVAADVREMGACRCTVAEIADRAGVGQTTVRNAIRKAKAKERGLIRVQHRPQWRNKWLSNVITIICRTWLGWLKRFRPNLGFSSKGVKKPASTDTYGFKNKSGRPFRQPEDGPSGRFQRFASRKPPSG
uniref:hypothetical protein n=1 Tax=Brucella pseudintermedia TaxID=370111 RepID=UPI001588C5FD|nr:hypothetical protein [Brucella pseudintermedia]